MKKLKQKIVKELKGKTILITGGAGSVGTYLTKKILEYPIKQVRIIDINEHGLFLLNRNLQDSRIRLLLGDINDKERIEMAGKGVDIVIHIAAIKNVEISEYNPIETIDININGTVNLVKMAMRNKPKIFLNISTDKAANASTLYGTTKQLTEKVTSWAGKYLKETKFASVRFGNVMESKGNVFEVWEEEKKNNKPLSITDPSMKRYFFHIDEAVDFVLKCLPLVSEGEVFVPKMKTYSVIKLASKTSKNHKIIGLRKGEKLDEILITNEEKKHTKEFEDMWVINY